MNNKPILTYENNDTSSNEVIPLSTIITITCSIHGDFKQTLSTHFAGVGCPLCCGKVGKNAKKIDDYIILCKLNKIYSLKEWFNFHDKNNTMMVIDGFVKHPYVKLGISCRDFSIQCFNRQQFNRSLEDHIKICQNNEIKTHGQWKNFHKKENKNKEGYSSDCWQKFNLSCKDFFEKINGRINIKSKKDIKSFILSKKIKTLEEWKLYFSKNEDWCKENGFRKYLWDVKKYNMTYMQWLYYIWPDRKLKSKQEIKKFIISNKIPSWRQWRMFHHKNKLGEIGYPKYPQSCPQYKMTIIQWTQYVFGKKVENKTKKQHRDYCLEYGITNCHMWIKHRKEYKLSKQGFVSTPPRTFGMTWTEWSEYVFGKKNIKTEKCHINLCVKKHITSGEKYRKIYKLNNMKKSGYFSDVFYKFGKGFFNKVRKILEPKKK